MAKLNRDVYVAVALLVFCGVMFHASFDIRTPDYGVLPPSVWPQVILSAMSVLSLIFLFQSLRGDAVVHIAEGENGPATILEWINYWRNPIICFVTFFGYLFLLPHVGMLVSGILFVFVLLSALGGVSPRQIVVHAAIAVIAVGGMWSLFTYGLNVMLPTGELFSHGHSATTVMAG